MKPFIMIVLCLAVVGHAMGQPADAPLGVGMVKPKLIAGEPLELFPPPESGPRAFANRAATDQVTFVAGTYHLEIGTAPPWFLPEVSKLDYDILLLRARTLTASRIEVVVNRETGKTAWVDRQAVEFLDWPSFWLTVFSIEVPDLDANPIRVKPLDRAFRVLSAKARSYRVLSVQGNWLHIGSADPAANDKPIGWIRWQDGTQLLVGYSLLS